MPHTLCTKLSLVTNDNAGSQSEEAFSVARASVLNNA